MSEISVNSESVRNGVSNIEKALDAIKKSQNNIDSAVDNLEKGIGSFDFQSIMSKLSSADARSGEIIRKSDDYISDAKAAEETLSNIYDDIYGNGTSDLGGLLDFDGNIELSSEDISLSSSEINSILTLLYQTNHAEDAAGLALQMLDSYDGISDADKEYIMDQMAEGNIRASVQYILTLMAKQDLEALKAKNNAKIKELNIKKGELLSEYYKYDDGVPQSPEMRAIDDEIARLEREISAQERVVRQYERANREWEYDKYFNKIGTEEFDIVVEIDFFKAAKDYYNDPDQNVRKNDLIVRDKGSYELAMASTLLNDNADDSFINWLKSDECDLENKDRLIDYYNRKIAGNDRSEIEIANKIIEAYNKEQEIQLPNIYKYEFLSSEEKEVLLYLYLTKGDKVAGQFVEDFKDTINKRWGYNRAKETFTNIITASENGVGVLGANWEGIKIGTEGWFSRIGAIFDSSGVNTGEEYAQMYVNSLLASLSYLTVIDASDVDNYIKDPSSLQKIKERQKNGEQITYADILVETGQITPEQAEGLKLMLKDERVAKFMNDSESSALGATHREWLKRFYNAGVSTGAMLPSMVISMATSGILGAGGVAPAAASTAGKYAGVASMFGYEFSVSRSEAIREGRSELEADIFAFLSAGGEGASEYLIGGTPFIAKGANLFKISSDSSLGWNVVKGLLNMLVIDPGQEILQEEVQSNILDPLSQLIPYGETNYKFSLEEFVETAITTYISTVEMHGLSVVSTVNEINLANLNKNTEVAVVEFNGQEIEISASDLLSCMDEKGELSPEKMGKIFAKKTGNNISTTNANTKNIANAPLRAVADIMSQYLNGEKRTVFDDGSSIIESDYVKDMVVSNPAVKDAFEKILSMAPNGSSQQILENILLKGECDGLKFDTNKCQNSTSSADVARRLSMATLFLTNPGTFNTLCNKGVDLFHGTTSAALADILSDGMWSSSDLVASGREVKTGEYSNQHNAKDVISFTDVFDVADSFTHRKDSKKGFSVILGTSSKLVSSLDTAKVPQSVDVEVGIKGNFAASDIDTIIVPRNKVKFVEKMVKKSGNDSNIEVLPMDKYYETKPFWFFENQITTYSDKLAALALNIKNNNGVNENLLNGSASDTAAVSPSLDTEALNVKNDNATNESSAGVSQANVNPTSSSLNGVTAAGVILGQLGGILKTGDTFADQVGEKVGNSGKTTGIGEENNAKLAGVSQANVNPTSSSLNGVNAAGKPWINFKAALKDRVIKPTLDEKTASKNERQLANQLAKILKELKVVKYGTDIQTLVNSYMTANGFDYQGFLNYIAKNSRIHNDEYQNFYKLEDIKALRENPKENLAKISKKLADITAYINEHGIESLSETNFDYLSFLSYCVASDSKFRTENFHELFRIGLDLKRIEQSVYDATRFATNYKGVDIITHGVNTEMLNDHMQRLLDIIDKAPKAIEYLIHDLDALEIYDGADPENLLVLLGETYLSDPNTKSFASAGGFTPSQNTIAFYNTGDFRGTFDHEIAHKLDNYVSSLTSTIRTYFTEGRSDWKIAIEQDNNSVSSYGDTKITEDFAEFNRKYGEALSGGTDIYEFWKKYPNRIRLFNALVQISNAAHGDYGGNFSSTLDALGTFDSYLGNNPSVLHKVLDRFSLNTAPENRISQAELFAKHGIVSQYINGYIKSEGFFDGFNGEQMMELYNVYERRGANQLPYVANTMLKSCEYDGAAVIDSLSSIEIKQGDYDAIIMSNIMDGLRRGDYEYANKYICEGMMNGNNPRLFNDVVKTVFANKKAGGA